MAGTLRGRKLATPKGTVTRPTTDRVRESVFSALMSMLGPGLGGGRALDGFAGSGALGFEAISRGVERVTFIERDGRALDVLSANAESLGVQDAVTIVRGDTFSLASRGVAGGPFSLLLLDPPYTLDASAISGLLERLACSGGLVEGCVVMWEHATGTAFMPPPGFCVRQTKRYGSTEVEFVVYERGSGTE